ncbi:MAG: hypothetical protein ACYTE3_22160 [Planctomycetota bacterium]|jgi:hypothetical protein
MAAKSSHDGQMSAKYHKSTRLAGLVLVCLLMAGILLFAVFSSSKSRWHCSPSQPRPNSTEAWKTMTGPSQPPENLDEDFFTSFTVRSDKKNFIVEHPVEQHPDNPFDYEVRKMTHGETLNIGGGTIAFCAIGTAYLDSTQTMEDGAPYRFWNAELQSITEEQARELNPYEFFKTSGGFRYSPFPGVQLGFQPKAMEDLMFHGITILAASTKAKLSAGYGSQRRPPYQWFRTHISSWRRAPVDIVIEVSYGPSRTFEFAPRAGEGFSEGSFECRLIHVFEDVDTSRYGSSSRDKTVILEFPKAQSDKAGLRFVFACQPTAIRMPVTFEFLDADGNVLSTGGSSTSGPIYDISMNHALEEVARVRACYRTQRRRVLIHLPYIPGLPEENNAIDDLFDLHIPYVRLHDAGQAGMFLARTLQLQSSSRTGPVPPNSINSIRFPLEFSDTTVREIARLYAEGGDLKVDIENEQLRLEYPVPLGTRLKRFLQRMFRRN